MIYNKIDIYVRRSHDDFFWYACSTNVFKTCKAAKEFYLKKFPQLSAKQIKTNFSKD